MKKRILIICLAFMASLAGTHPPPTALYITETTPINPHLKLWKAIKQVESGNNPLAYNEREQATGIAQIRPIKLIDYNKATKKQYQINEMFDTTKSKEVFMWHCNQYANDLETIARKWNGSGDKTTEYWQKVERLLK